MGRSKLKNARRVEAGRQAARTIAKRRWVARATGITIGVASAAIMQAHGLPLWLEHGGWLTVAAIICIDAAILYLAARGGKTATAIAVLGMFVVIAGPLYVVASPAMDSYGVYARANIRLQELPDVEAAIREGERAISVMYMASKITAAQPHQEALERARARRAELLKAQADEADLTRVGRDMAFSALHAIVIVVMQLSAFACVRVARNG